MFYSMDNVVWILVIITSQFGFTRSEGLSYNKVHQACLTNHGKPFEVAIELEKQTSALLLSPTRNKSISEVQVNVFESNLEGFSILYGLTKVANDSLVSEVCLKELRQIQQSVLLKKPWAMKVLDASASKPAGFMFQHNFWLGSREACTAAREPLRITLNQFIKRNMKPGLVEDVAPFEVDFRVVYMKHHSPWQMELTLMTKPVLHVGLCLPASCSSTEIQGLMQDLMHRQSFIPADLYEFHGEVLYVKDLKLKKHFYERKSFKILIALMLFTGAMMLCAFYIMSLSERTESRVAENGCDIKSKGVHRDRSGAFAGSVTDFIECFDFRKNCQKIFSTSEYTISDIPAINGLRSLSAFGILFMHAGFYTLHTVHNVPHLLNQLEMNSAQLQNITIYLVDVFFTISGFLQTFHFLRDATEMKTIRRNPLVKNIQRLMVNLLQRYLRLAPLYFVIVGVVDLLTAYINDVSLFHIYDRYNEVCPQYWWRHVLFIQSYFSHDGLCPTWSWSLSCEMQYFILGTMLLFAYVKHPQCIKCCVLALLASNIGWSIFRGITQKFQFGFETAYLTLDELYIDPLVRVMPYILGSMAAWCLLQHKNGLKISCTLERNLWNLASVLFVGSAYTMYWRDLNYLGSISIYLLGRLMVTLVVCWIIMASAMGRRCWWSRILEASIFQHINRLTYAIYLLNPVIITYFASMSETSTKAEIGSQILNCCGYGIIVYLASIIFSLAFEVPYSNWSERLKRRYKYKNIKYYKNIK